MRRLSDIFLTPSEKETFCHWDEKKVDNSITTLILKPLWYKVVTQVPETVAPNILSLGSLLFLIHAWYICYMYMSVYPRLISLAALLLLFASHTLDNIDGKHAKAINNDSPLGELFAHCCNNIGYIFSTLVGCALLQINDLSTQWYLVQIGQLLSLIAHIYALEKKEVKYMRGTGPGEIVFVFLVIIGLRETIGLGILRILFNVVSSVFITIANLFGSNIDSTDYNTLLLLLVRLLFYALIALVIYMSTTLPKENEGTRNGIIFCIFYRLVPAVLIYYGLFPKGPTPLDVICSGLFFSMVTSDLIVCKMANRNLHPWIVVFAMMSILDDFFILFSATIYYVGLFYEISEYMQLSMFAVTCNVYVDGVYDMCHLGHFNSFKQALSYGTRLFVGVLSDKDVQSYKRAPIMTMEERAAVVATSKYVHKVIAPAPFPGIPEEFIKKHRIHVVCLSPEYDKADDRYYAIPRKMGIAKVTERTEGMSTSELIRRAKEYKEK